MKLCIGLKFIVIPGRADRREPEIPAHAGISGRVGDGAIFGLDPRAGEAIRARVVDQRQRAGLKALGVEIAPVSVGELTFDILHCPGHSPGSVVFFNKDMRFAHVGDVLFSGSVGRSDIPGAERGRHLDIAAA